MKATFENTVDILVKAYLNNTLEHQWCSACAVGNLVAHHIGTAPVSENSYFANGEQSHWSKVFYTASEQNIIMTNYIGKAKEQIDSTGYTVKELAAIEYAFEKAPRKCKSNDFRNEEWMFNGLMAVVDVLAEIHNVDLSVKESAKALFVKI